MISKKTVPIAVTFLICAAVVFCVFLVTSASEHNANVNAGGQQQSGWPPLDNNLTPVRAGWYILCGPNAGEGQAVDYTQDQAVYLNPGQVLLTWQGKPTQAQINSACG